MRVTQCRLDGLGGELLDVDVGDGETWVALVQARRGRQRVIFKEDASVTLPRRSRFDFVRVRARASGRRRGTRSSHDKPNGALVDRSGSFDRVFRFGDAIEDVLPSGQQIAVTYFDEGIFGGCGASCEGVAIFGLDGELRFGYHSSGLGGEFHIDTCYCATWATERRLLFRPYTGASRRAPNFRLIAIDFNTMRHDVWPTPKRLHLAHALTPGPGADGREVVFLHGGFEDQTGVYRWRVGDRRAQRLGDHPGELRGLRGVRFLATGHAGYTILTPAEP
jgi:hypothetical protein